MSTTSLNRSADRAVPNEQKRFVTSWLGHPVTIFLALQYGLLVCYPAVRRGTTSPFIYGLPLAVIALSFAIEHLVPPAKAGVRPSSHHPGVTAGFAVALIGLGAKLIVALLGATTYAGQIGTREPSSWAAVFSPLPPWLIVGTGIILFRWSEGRCSRSQALTFLGLLSGFSLIIAALVQGIMASAIAYCFGAAFGAATVRLLKLSHVIAGIAILILAWPVVFTYRQETRLLAGQNPNLLRLQNAGTRLELDLLLQYAHDIKISTSALPSPLQTLRYGTIPRVLDPGRPDFSVDNVYSVAIGSAANNSVTFTTIGSQYAVTGWGGVAIFSVSSAAVIGFLLRRRGCWAFVIALIAAVNLLWIETNYPQNIASLLQSIESAGWAYLALKGWRAVFVDPYIRPRELRSTGGALHSG